MGCVASRIDKEERVRICKDRKRLMKQLVGFRGEFAYAQLVYLRALKNTGVTLRQFTESELLELETTPFAAKLPPSPPPPLPPSPPPPPTFSPEFRKFEDNKTVENPQEDVIEIDEDNNCTPPPPPVPSSSWDFWDPFDPSSPQKKSEMGELIEEENWAEANTEFEEEDREEGVFANNVVNVITEKPKTVELVDDNSSMMSWYTKDTNDMAMVLWRSKKSFAGVVKELDDYFLKASAGGKDIAVFMDINGSNGYLSHNFKEYKRKRSNSAKVVSALTCSWSSKSFQFNRDAVELRNTSEPCRPGAHCITLEKLFSEERRLYNEVKEEEITKLEHEKKSLLLQKLEDEDHDSMKTEKTRSSVETLQSKITCLQQSISETCSSILKLIDEELHPQLIALTSGLIHMWRTMYECHQVQNHISQQVNHLINQQSVDPTSNYHRQAGAQLKTEVATWYNSFCKLMESQREYVRALSRWIQLADCLVDGSQQNGTSSALHALCEKWQLALDKLSDKVASEAIKSLLSVINSIVLQQEVELNLQKKSDKLEKKLQRDMNSIAEMELKLAASFNTEDSKSDLSPKHPLSIKRAKIEVLKKQVDDAKAKYLSSVQVTKAMTLNNLKTSLSNVFQALMGFSSAYVQNFEAIHGHAEPVDSHDGSISPIG